MLLSVSGYLKGTTSPLLYLWAQLTPQKQKTLHGESGGKQETREVVIRAINL